MITHLFLGGVYTFRQFSGKLVDQDVRWKRLVGFFALNAALLLENYVKG